jgi:hypothetical protein
MRHNFSELNLESLKALYDKENERLQTRLLSGALWEEVKEERHTITELSIALHRKLTELHALNPAEFPSSETNRSPREV